MKMTSEIHQIITPHKKFIKTQDFQDFVDFLIFSLKRGPFLGFFPAEFGYLGGISENWRILSIFWRFSRILAKSDLQKVEIITRHKKSDLKKWSILGICSGFFIKRVQKRSSGVSKRVQSPLRGSKKGSKGSRKGSEGSRKGSKVLWEGPKKGPRGLEKGPRGLEKGPELEKWPPKPENPRFPRGDPPKTFKVPSKVVQTGPEPEKWPEKPEKWLEKGPI
jgi:hypothetical protein